MIVQLNAHPSARQAEILKIKTLREQNPNSPFVGVEVSVPELAQAIIQAGGVNIDPQHSEDRSDVAAIEAAQDYDVQGGDAVYFIIRPDLDCIGAIIRMKGESVRPELVTMIAAADKFASDEWQPLNSPFEKGFLTPELGGINTLFRDRKYFTLPLEEKYETVLNWMKTGEVPEHLEADYQSFKTQVMESLSSGETSTEVCGNIAIVTTKLDAQTIGYAAAPVVIAFNPEMPFFDRETKETRLVVKWSIMQWQEGWVNMPAIKSELQLLEPGVGGSPTFIGSAQGESSKYTPEKLLQVVQKHLLR